MIHSRYDKRSVFISLHCILIPLWISFLLNFVMISSTGFLFKAYVFITLIYVYTLLVLFSKLETIIFYLIFACFFNVPISSLYTSSTNLIIVYSLIIISFRSVLTGTEFFSLGLIRRNGVTLPLIAIIVSYTVSFMLISSGFWFHLDFYSSIICGVLLIWSIIGSIKHRYQILIINRILLGILLFNLIFSLLLLFFPGLDLIRAKFFSLTIFHGETATRLQGFSFRGEAYGEYLMICSLWLLVMLSNRQIVRGRYVLWAIALCGVVALFLTRLRGPLVVLLLGVLFFVIGARSVRFSRKILLVTVTSLMLLVSFALVSSFSHRTGVLETTVIERLGSLFDETKAVGYIPSTRYYTWVPALRFAASHNFIGTGPSFLPSIAVDRTFKDIILDEAQGNVLVWPHNLTLLILCTVGFYGIASYLFLLVRAFRLRKTYQQFEPYFKYSYSAYLLCLTAFVIEAQKFDGALRQSCTSFYFVCIIIGMLFTADNLAYSEQLEYIT